jgi:hypothetical protein
VQAVLAHRARSGAAAPPTYQRVDGDDSPRATRSWRRGKPSDPKGFYILLVNLSTGHLKPYFSSVSELCQPTNQALGRAATPEALRCGRAAAAKELERTRGVIVLWDFRGGGRPVASFRRAWHAVCQKAGVPGMIFHDLRRTAAPPPAWL